MVTIEKLDIVPKHNYIRLEASVKSIRNYYTNIYITKVLLYKSDTFVSDTNKGTPVYSKTTMTNASGTEVPLSTKSISLDITEADLAEGTEIGNNTFFVEIYADGTPAPSCPCDMQNNSTYGFVFNKCGIYNMIFNSLGELNSKCEPPRNLMDLLLKYKAVKMSAEFGEWKQARELYKKFFVDGNISIPSGRGCGCRG